MIDGLDEIDAACLRLLTAARVDFPDKFDFLRLPDNGTAALSDARRVFIDLGERDVWIPLAQIGIRYGRTQSIDQVIAQLQPRKIGLDDDSSDEQRLGYTEDIESMEMECRSKERMTDECVGDDLGNRLHVKGVDFSEIEERQVIGLERLEFGRHFAGRAHGDAFQLAANSSRYGEAQVYVHGRLRCMRLSGFLKLGKMQILA